MYGFLLSFPMGKASEMSRDLSELASSVSCLFLHLPPVPSGVTATKLWKASEGQYAEGTEQGPPVEGRCYLNSCVGSGLKVLSDLDL